VSRRRRAWFVGCAERDASRLSRQKATWASGLSQLVLSVASTLRGRRDDALGCLQRAEELFGEAGMHLHRAVARRRHGELIEGRAGELLIEDADEWLNRNGILNSERFSAIFVPAAIHDSGSGTGGDSRLATASPR
jgi:hypothetical protein